MAPRPERELSLRTSSSPGRLFRLPRPVSLSGRDGLRVGPSCHMLLFPGGGTSLASHHSRRARRFQVPPGLLFYLFSLRPPRRPCWFSATTAPLRPHACSRQAFPSSASSRLAVSHPAPPGIDPFLCLASTFTHRSSVICAARLPVQWVPRPLRPYLHIHLSNPLLTTFFFRGARALCTSFSRRWIS